MSKTYQYILDFVGNNGQLLNSINQLNKGIEDYVKKSNDAKTAVNKVFSAPPNLLNKSVDQLTDRSKRLTDILNRMVYSANPERFNRLNAELVRTNSVLDSAKKRVANLNGELDKGKAATYSYITSFKNVAGALGIAFGVNELKNAVVDSVNLAAQASGVESAFKRIATARDLDVLRSSVKGTVSDLKLMKSAVMADNFEIPLKQLASLFEFAAKRAQDTGQSIDYLVESIILGIGRKSPLILDNLGISAVKLREKFGGLNAEQRSVADIAKAVGEIASEAMRKSGELLDNEGAKIQRVAASWENLKVVAGRSILNNTSIAKDLDDWSKLFEIWGNDVTTTWQAVISSLSQTQMDKVYKIIEAQKLSQKAMDEYQKNIEMAKRSGKTADDDKQKTATKEYANSLDGLNEKLKDYKEQLMAIAPTDRGALLAKFAQINAIELQVEKLDKLREASKKLAADTQAGLRSDKLQPLALRGTANVQVSLDKKDKDFIPESWFKRLHRMDESIEANAKRMKKWKEQLLDDAETIAGGFQQGFDQIGASIVNTFGLADNGLQGFVKGMFETTTRLISMLLAQSLGNAIAGATASGAATGPAAIFATPAFIAEAVTGVLGAFAAIPKFASGGLVYGPTVGMIGEYPGASSNPEVIAPLSKLKGMIQQNSQTIVLQPSIEYSGNGLRVMLNRIDKHMYKQT